MTLVRTTNGSCSESFSNTDVSKMKADRSMNTSTTALGLCSVAVAMVILTSNTIGNKTQPVMQDASTPSLALLVFISVVFLYTIGFGDASWLSLARKVDDVVLKVSSSQTLTRIKSSVSASSIRLAEFASQLHSSRKAVQRTIRASAWDISYTKEAIAELTLADFGNLARFVTDLNRLDFNKEIFLSTVGNGARSASKEISKVIALSRGAKVAISTPPLNCESTIEDADALAFVAFVRIFAEWRSERLVPPGYGRYAAGMGLAKRDLIQNLQKIESAVHSYLNDMETRNGAAVDFANGRQLSSPTLGQLLRWEKAQGIHPRLPKLTDRSGASGLLWTQRQLQYQITVFDNLLLVPSTYLTAKDAVNAAYKSTYDLYHGFIIKQMFQGSFDAAPAVSVILQHMNDSWSNDFEEILTSTSTSSQSECAPEEPPIPPMSKTENSNTAEETLNPFQVVACHVTNEWIKIERFLKQCGGIQRKSQSRNLLVITEELEEQDYPEKPAGGFAVTQPPSSKQTSEEEIPAFVAVVQPLLTELNALIVKLNMKDPTRC